MLESTVMYQVWGKRDGPSELIDQFPKSEDAEDYMDQLLHNPHSEVTEAWIEEAEV